MGGVRGRQVLCDLTHVWNLSKPKSWKQGVEVVARGLGMGEWGRCQSKSTNF